MTLETDLGAGPRGSRAVGDSTKYRDHRANQVHAPAWSMPVPAVRLGTGVGL